MFYLVDMIILINFALQNSESNPHNGTDSSQPFRVIDFDI